jgi:hypothetical protein
MFFTLMTATAGTWLMFTPLLWPEQPDRAILAACLGLVAVALAPFTVAAPRARLGVAFAGLVLSVANFVLPGELGSIANFAVSGLALFAAGMAPTPRTVAVMQALPVRAPVSTIASSEPEARAKAA